MKSRGPILAVALVLALGATGAVALYVRGARADAPGGGQTLSVIVSKQDIDPGTRLDPLLSEGTFSTLSIPRAALVRDSVTDLSQLRGRTTSSSILAGEQISLLRLGESSELGGGRLGLRAGFEALTLKLDAASAGAGLLRPNDHVTVFAGFHTAGNNGTASVAGGDKVAVPGLTVALVPDARVLRVTATETTKPDSDALITLEVSPADAARVLFSQQQGTVWLVLLAPNQTGTAQPATGFQQVVER